ncbi:MAG TPA: hypothetical protein VKD71_05120 [Gemmataceae bacterium]|nr:hypothetical protein [Gemmataceae bacterium]
MATMQSVRWGASALVILALLPGCDSGSQTGEVTGTVKVAGQIPPAGSSITFIPTDGKSQTAGAMLQDGRYSVRVPVGMTKVEIRVPRPVARSGPKVQGPGSEGGLIEESLPAKYNDESELTFEVKPGKNEKDWDLPTN